MKSIFVRITILFLVMILFFSAFSTVNAENSVPSYIENIHKRYLEISELLGHTYTIGQSVESHYHEKDVISDAFTSYSFDILVPSTEYYTPYVLFSMDSLRLDNKSFSINCYNDRVPAKVIKELILATLYVADEGITDEAAQQALNSIVISFDGKNHSDVFECESYLVFVTYDETYSGDKMTDIHIIDKNELVLKEEERALYSQMTYAEMCAPLNAGEYVTFTGIPTKRLPNTSTSWLDLNAEYWEVALPDGLVNIRINFNSTPISLELNTSYIFWGQITSGSDNENCTIRIDYATIP